MKTPQSGEMRSSETPGFKTLFVGIIDDTELLKSADEILNEIARLIWQKMGHDDAHPPVTIESLRQWNSQRRDTTGVPPRTPFLDAANEFPDPPAADPEPEAWRDKMWYRFDRCFLYHQKKMPAPDSWRDKVHLEYVPRQNKSNENMLASFATSFQGEHNKPTGSHAVKSPLISTPPLPKNAAAASRRNLVAIYIFSILEGGFSEESVLMQHLFYSEVTTLFPDANIKMILSPIIQAYFEDYILQQNAKPITKEYDRRHPVGVLHSKTTARFRDVLLPAELESEAATLQYTDNIPSSGQLYFPHLEYLGVASILPSVLPLQTINGIGLEARDGQVPMVVRLFFEGLMALDPRVTKDDVCFKLGELTEYLHMNPDSRKSLRITKRQIERVVKGLLRLQFITIPYVEKNGGPGLWLPVRPQNLPTDASDKDFPVILTVSTPPDAMGGVMVEKALFRLLGKSSTQSNAYLSVCGIFDKHGTSRQGIIAPTRPKKNSPRNESKQLLHADGTLMKDSQGKPITDLYHPEAIPYLEREDNPTALQRYPVWSPTDLVRACYPKGYDRSKFATYRARAETAWDELVNHGVIEVNERPDGWQIFPGNRHLSVYRGVKNMADRKKH